jgi:predicted unusual protein kinase regulating ubiquinone biosynthesis (AarF/ABC1/UbiB family)
MLLHPRYIARLRHVATVLVRHGFADVLRALDLQRFMPGRKRAITRTEKTQQRARELRLALEELGATYIKLGQVLSTRPDILSPPYLEELEGLQDQVEPFPFAEVKRAVEKELGKPVSEVFASLEERPVASASLAQVHRAELRPGISALRQVAVKVLRPGVEQEVRSDLGLLVELAPLVSRSTLGRRYDVRAVVAELDRTLSAELDLTREAANAIRLRKALEEFPRVRVPEVVESLTTPRLLVLAFVEGRRVASVAPAARPKALAAELWRAYLKQILVDGIFHCDPHPGNVLVDAEERAWILDHGMVAYLSRETQLRLMALLLALADRDGERVADACTEIGIPGSGFRAREFKSEIGLMVARYSGLAVGELPLGRIVMELVTTAYRRDIRIPPDMMLLGKTLLNLEGICRQLDPSLDPVSTMKDMAVSLLGQQMTRELSAQRMLAAALELRSLLNELPVNLRRILARTGSNELQLNIRIDREPEMEASVQKVASRITLGLITASLIVGSALLVNVPARTTLWGYPLVALAGFLLAAGLGLYLVGKIILVDRY